MASACSLRARAAGVVAAVLGDDPEVGVEAAHARLVVEPLPDRETLLVPGLGRVVVAALGRDGPGQVEDLARPVVCPDGLERGPRLVQSGGRVVEPALLAGDLGEGRLAPALCGPVAEARSRGTARRRATVSATAQSPTSSWTLASLSIASVRSASPSSGTRRVR